MAEKQISTGGSGSFSTYGYTCVNPTVNPPARITSRVQIPFGSGYYDFSDVYGVRYEQREATFEFERAYGTQDAAIAGANEFIAWLMSISEAELTVGALGDRIMVGATVDSVEHYIEGGTLVHVTANVTAQPLLKDGSI